MNYSLLLIVISSFYYYYDLLFNLLLSSFFMYLVLISLSLSNEELKYINNSFLNITIKLQLCYC
jgi:hypothetical protein